MEQETIIIKMPAEFKQAIEDEAERKLFSTTAEFIRSRLRYCLNKGRGEHVQADGADE